jgi:hypothetical protein
MKTEMKTYIFEGIAWVPGYGDFDVEWITVVAENEEMAWIELAGKRIYWKGKPSIREQKA